MNRSSHPLSEAVVMLPSPIRFHRSVPARSWQGILVATSLYMGLTGCQSVLLTTRFQPLDPRPEAQEVALGTQVYREVLGTEPKSQNATLSQMLDRVGQRLAAASGRPDFQWEFTLLSGPRRDAFCLPGGKVIVYEGLLPVCAHEAGLAVVVSHEIAHVLSRHSTDRLTQQIRTAEGAPAFARIQLGGDSKRIETMRTLYGLGPQDKAPPPFSRTQEDEADSIGLLLMARAGYDPQAAPQFWERFHQGTEPTGPDLLSKHPRDDTRTAKLKEIVPRALSVYHSAPQRYGLGEPISEEALAELDLSPAAPTNMGTTPRDTVPARSAAPSTNMSAITIAPAPIVQVGWTETPPAPAPNDALSWADFGAPTAPGTPLPAAASPIVTASLEVLSPPAAEAPGPAENLIFEWDLSAEAEAAPAFPSAEELVEGHPPLREESSDWKPHHE